MCPYFFNTAQLLTAHVGIQHYYMYLSSILQQPLVYLYDRWAKEPYLKVTPLARYHIVIYL